MLDPSTLDWEKMDGLIPVIVQQVFDGRVLMQAYMTREALQTTIESGRVCFWSRSRNTLWTKGETSGNYLELISVLPDCDGDCLLVFARPRGPTCHRGTATCFDGDSPNAPGLAFLADLGSLVAERERDRPEGSYTTQLFESGLKRIAQKVGEEGVETALAGSGGNQEELLNESADLVYHLLVLLAARQTGLEDLVRVLRARNDR
jgi:phosphoribosyl-ATP pyrophosphohydrolase/phosphoribosyl-AMP cyclohydrolase